MIKIAAFFLIFITVGQVSIAQSGKKMFVRFEYNSTAKPNGDSSKISLYYIVDSTNNIMYDKVPYYAFSFSSDTNSLDGYVSFDKKQRTMFYISKYYKDTVQCTNANIKQVLFSFSSSNLHKLCYAGFLGSPTKLILVKNTANKKQAYLIKPIYDLKPPSNTVFIQSMYFEDYLYPKRITFFDPFLNKSVVVSCKNERL